MDSEDSEIGEKKDTMINLLGGEGVTPTRIETLRKEMAAIQDNVEKTVIAHVLDVKKILDDNQIGICVQQLRRHREKLTDQRKGEKPSLSSAAAMEQLAQAELARDESEDEEY